MPDREWVELNKTPRIIAGLIPNRYFVHIMIFTIVAAVTFTGGWKHTKSIETLVEERSFAPQTVNEGFLNKPLVSFVSQNPVVEASTTGIGPEPVLQAAGPKQRTEIIVYTVKAGDTVSDLATAYEISIDTIRWANKLDDVHSLSIGQKIEIMPISGVLHTIASGDTLSGIASKYKADAGAIIEYNKLANPDRLAKDARLVVPGGKWEEPERPQPVARSDRPQTVAPAVAAAAAQPAAAPQVVPVAPPSSSQVDVVNFALGFSGKPYIWGGASPRGFDCSGFIYYVYNQKGIRMPRDLWGQVQASKPVPRESLQPGDIVFFSNTYTSGLSHDGIYIGGGKFIHAESERKGVTITDLGNPYWSSRYYGGRRP